MITVEIGALVKGLVVSVEALAALGAAMRDKLDDQRVHPEVLPQLEAVVAALLGDNLLEHLNKQDLVALLNLVQSSFRQALDLLENAARPPGWYYTDPDVLLAQGQSGVIFPTLLIENWAPHLDGLIESLQAPGALFLDIGVGVGEISIAMCNAWPSLSAVGIDPWEPAIVLARGNVRAAGLLDRIELRLSAAEQLRDRGRFDLAWLPTSFIRRHAFNQAINNVSGALRPGAWLIVGINSGADDPLSAALDHLRTFRSGGSVLSVDEAINRLKETNLESVKLIPDELPVPVKVVVARRPYLKTQLG